MRIGVMLRAIDEKQGIGVYTRNLMDELLALDRRNEYVLFYADPAQLGRYAQHAHVSERAFGGRGALYWDQVQVPAQARREGLDAIFHPKFTVPLATRRKTAMTVHGASWFVRPDLYDDKWDLAYVRAAMPIYCRKADFIIANSDLTRDDFMRLLRVPPERIATIRLGTSPAFRAEPDPAQLRAARVKYALPERFVLAVSKYDPRKNFANLIAAFRLLRRRLRVGLVVTGIGCERYIEEHQLAADGTLADVRFLGWVDHAELPALYRLAACHFMPSVYEEFGIPSAEAMAAGCPQVVASTGALPEIVGDAGLAVDPFDPPRLADALERVLCEPGLAEALRARAFERAREFTWERCARETHAALERLG